LNGNVYETTPEDTSYHSSDEILSGPNCSATTERGKRRKRRKRRKGEKGKRENKRGKRLAPENHSRSINVIEPKTDTDTPCEIPRSSL
jgi:hypothetical protein